MKPESSNRQGTPSPALRPNPVIRRKFKRLARWRRKKRVDSWRLCAVWGGDGAGSTVRMQTSSSSSGAEAPQAAFHTTDRRPGRGETPPPLQMNANVGVCCSPADVPAAPKASQAPAPLAFPSRPVGACAHLAWAQRVACAVTGEGVLSNEERARRRSSLGRLSPNGASGSGLFLRLLVYQPASGASMRRLRRAQNSLLFKHLE